MTFVDTITVLLFVASIAFGYMRGLVKQVTSLIGYVLGIIACNAFGDVATEVLTTVMPSSVHWPLPSITTHAVAVIAMFLLISLSVRVAGIFIKNTIGMLHLGIVDRLGGAALRMFKYFFIFSILLNLWFLINPHSDTFTTEHMLGNKPFVATINLAPRVLGQETMPGDSIEAARENHLQLVDDDGEEDQSDNKSLI